jgi:hypothetical protein
MRRAPGLRTLQTALVLDFMTRKRVLVADDLTPVVAALLRESFDVVGMVSDGQAALESTLRQRK